MGSLLKGVGKAVKKIARPKVLLPLAAIAIGGPMLAKAAAAKSAAAGTAAAAGAGAGAGAGTGSGIMSALFGTAPSTVATGATTAGKTARAMNLLKAGSSAANIFPATSGFLGTAGSFAPLKGTLAKGAMYGLKNPFTKQGLMTYGGAGLGLASLMGKPKTEEQKNLGVDAQAQYNLTREMNRMMGGAYTDEQLNTITAPMLSQYGGEYEAFTGPERKRRMMFPGLNYSGLTRYAADGGSIEPIDKEENQQMIMDALLGETTPGMNEDAIAEQMVDMMRTEELNPTGRAMGGRVNMGLGGLLGRAFREGMEAAMKNPNLGKIFGKSGGDLDIGDIIKMEKPVPKVSPRDSRVGGIDLFGRRRQREIDTLQDDVIDQMMEMDSIEGFAMGGSIPQTNGVPSGMQLDGRGGGFIPMGAKERKDDVPAMLAKNEFVMTADAVRGAGDGNVNVGAQRMYDLMNNLESKV